MKGPGLPVSGLAPTSRLLGLLGLVGLAAIGLGLVRGTLDLGEAGVRAGLVLGALLLADRLLVPLASALVGPPRAADRDTRSA